MLRRNFFKALTLAGGLILPHTRQKAEIIPSKGNDHVDFSITDNIINMYIPQVTKFTRIIQISDTHLWMDDERGRDYIPYSRRMARAYNTTKHFQSGVETNPMESFEKTLSIAIEKKADLIVLTGDIFSFPSEAAIEWVLKKLKATNIPYIYTSGNHDWHYEGMEGPIDDLRSTWINKRLSALYPSPQFLYGVYPLNGLKAVSYTHLDVYKRQIL